MGCCGDASVWAKVGLLCTICAFGLQTAGYVTNNWMVYNTVKDLIDVRVGLWWFTNCSADISCYSETTPSNYTSLSFTLTKGLEGGNTGLLLITTIMFCFYVMADRSRTRAVAIAIIILFILAVGTSIGGMVLWILQIDFPYFLAWSAGLSVVATVFTLIAILCLIPDLKEYPYEKLQVMPAERQPRGVKQTFYTKHGGDKKGDSLGRDYSRRDPYSDAKNKRDLGHEHGRRDPYSKNKEYSDMDRFSLNVVTPSRPPRADFFSNNGGNRY